MKPRQIQRKSQFKKDFKKIAKQSRDMQKLKNIVEQLKNRKKLDDKHKDHPLVGNYKGYRECHIEPDWSLIYQIDEDVLVLVRTGSHSELFKKMSTHSQQ